MDKSRTSGETEQDYLRSQCESAECAVSHQGIWRDHRHGKSEPQAPAHEPSRRVRHQSEKSVVIQMAQNDNHMTTLELVLNMLAEASTTEISTQKAPGIPRAWYAGSLFARNL